MTEFGSVPCVQVDFVRSTVQAELDGFIGWPASQVIFQLHVDSVHYFPRDDRLLFGPITFDIALVPQDMTFPFLARTYDTNAGVLRGLRRIGPIRAVGEPRRAAAPACFVSLCRAIRPPRRKHVVGG